MRHNDLRDFTANLLTEVCPNVCIEQPVQTLTGELLSHDTSNSEDGARLDISTQGFGVIVIIGHFLMCCVLDTQGSEMRIKSR